MASSTDLSNICCDRKEINQNNGDLHAGSCHNLLNSPVGMSYTRCTNRDQSFESPSSSRFFGHKLLGFWWDQKQNLKRQQSVKMKAGIPWYRRNRIKGILACIGLISLFFLVEFFMLLRLPNSDESQLSSNPYSARLKFSVPRQLVKSGGKKKLHNAVYQRLLAMAAHALAERQDKPEPKDLWQEPFAAASAWKPCSNQRNWDPNDGRNGYIMITANGGMNQQRVAVCNAVVIARLLNATLVIPKFMYSSVWRDVSQFGDIYQEEFFINYLAPDIRIVKELPRNLQSLDLEAIGSVVTDQDIRKESKLSFYLRSILPILLQNRVVHFFGFGNRLAFDPIPLHLQFVPKIQEAGALLIHRMREHDPHLRPLDHHLVGSYAESILTRKRGHSTKASRYLALHLRFEMDMVAHSLCEFGGGEEERIELEAYREVHFPALTALKKSSKLPSPEEFRSEGLCPLTPEEAVLMLSALGFDRSTNLFVAGAKIYGGQKRLAALTSLYPNMITKENLLSPTELEPFANYSSQLAALDFIACTAADAFAMTDSGSQLSSLVSGYRIYYGGGRMPTIRPNKRRLASTFLKNNTIEWRSFEHSVRKAIRQTKSVRTRPKARSVYRYPRCTECMCLRE